jgi:hypothetical protein
LLTRARESLRQALAAEKEAERQAEAARDEDYHTHLSDRRPG